MPNKSKHQIDWLVHPGKGSTTLFIGQGRNEVEALLGSPDTVVSKFQSHFYYIYRELGLQIDFVSQNAPAQVLFFHHNSVNGYKQSLAKTQDGLGPGTPRARISAVLDSPNKSGEVGAGDSKRVWIWYGIGIQFEFGRNAIAEIMSIFNSERSFSEQIAD